jgi:hypothetical protein
MLADLDYLESRTTEKNTNSMVIWKSLWSLQRAHAIAVLTEWDEFVSMIGSAYDSMQKPAFVLMEEIYWTVQLWKNRICVSKYRFLGSQPILYKGEGPKQKKGFIDYIRKLRTTQLL